MQPSRHAVLLLTLLSFGIADPAVTAEPADGCLRVKGWETLPETGRLCAYLADVDAMDRCEQRGYRLDDRLTTEVVASMQQSLLLCQDEYVIEVRGGNGSDKGTLSVKTALLETSGELAGEYTRGRVLRLERDGPVWRETDVDRWSNYAGAGPE